MWAAWYVLVRRGGGPLAVGISSIAFNATQYVKAGRKLGRAAIDVHDGRAGLRLINIDRKDDGGGTLTPTPGGNG